MCLDLWTGMAGFDVWSQNTVGRDTGSGVPLNLQSQPPLSVLSSVSHMWWQIQRGPSCSPKSSLLAALQQEVSQRLRQAPPLVLHARVQVDGVQAFSLASFLWTIIFQSVILQGSGGGMWGAHIFLPEVFSDISTRSWWEVTRVLHNEEWGLCLDIPLRFCSWHPNNKEAKDWGCGPK